MINFMTLRHFFTRNTCNSCDSLENRAIILLVCLICLISNINAQECALLPISNMVTITGDPWTTEFSLAKNELHFDGIIPIFRRGVLGFQGGNFLSSTDGKISASLVSSPTYLLRRVRLAEDISFEVSQSLVTIRTIRKEGEKLSKSEASGFFVNDRGWLATNLHCIKGAHHVDVHTAGHHCWIDSIIIEDSKHDLAIACVTNLVVAVPPLLPWNMECPKVNDWVIATRVPLETAPTNSNGFVTSICDNLTSGIDFLIEFNAPVGEGYSGSPLVNSDREVIGVATWKLIDIQGQEKGLFLAVPIRRVHDLLKEVGIKCRRSKK